MKKYLKQLLDRLLTSYNLGRHLYGKQALRYFAAIPSANVDKSVVFEDFFSVSGDLRDIEVSISEGVQFRKYCHLLLHPGARLTIGKNVFFNNYCSISCLDQISIGENTLFGEGVKIYDHNHKHSFNAKKLTIARDEFSKSPVRIGKNCWIGSNVTILKNVEIGDNVIIGANCLVYKNIRSNSIVKLNVSLTIEEQPD